MAVLLVFLHYYYRLAIGPQAPSRTLLDRYREIAAGTDRAPDQYRLLIPRLGTTVSRITGLPLPDVVILIDGGALLGGALLLAELLRRRGLAGYILPALLFLTALAAANLENPRPETMPAFLAATCVLAAYAEPGRSTRLLGILGAVLLAGCRPEMVAAAAAPFALRWWRDRHGRDQLAAAAALGVLGAVGTIIPIRLYPDTPYLTEVIQVGHNLDLWNFLVPVLCLAPLLAFLTRTAVRDWAPLLGWVAAELAFSFVVGRIEESRIYFPLTAVVGYVAAHLWSDHLSGRARMSERSLPLSRGRP